MQLVNIGTWNSKCMGGRAHFLPFVLVINSAVACIAYSCFPGKRRIRHTIARCSGSYFALPDVTRTLHLAVFGGQGILKTILVAIKSLLKLDIAFTLKTAVDPPRSSTTGMMRNGSLTFSVIWKTKT